jgi:hypothetical protein
MKITRALARLAAVGAVAGTTVALSTSGAHAVGLNVEYDATGTSHVAHTDSDLWIKPTTLSLTVESADGTFTGHLPILPADTKFHVLGLLPIKAQVNFVEAAPLTGALHQTANGVQVTSSASYYIRLSDVLVGGIPTYVGDHCQTKDPVVVEADTPAGGSFDLNNGGELTGTFSIGDFQNCFLETGLINLLVPGSGNTIDLTVSNGRLSVA